LKIWLYNNLDMSTYLQSISRNFDHKCSKLLCEVKKFIMRLTDQFVNYAFDWLLLLQGPIGDFVYKLACEFQYELANFVTKFGTFVVTVS
jgi:hypothetical protein